MVVRRLADCPVRNSSHSHKLRRTLRDCGRPGMRADGRLYMADTPKFRVRDSPGGLDDAVRLSLANSLVGLGYLRVSP